MSSQRILRVNELLKREIADLLERVDFRMENTLVSVSEVDVAPDLRTAKVHISVLGGDDETKNKIMKFLRTNRVILQKKIARDITLKYTPVLTFINDSRMEKGDRVLAILEEMEGE
jgi:ribosome-binding factor A